MRKQQAETEKGLLAQIAAQKKVKKVEEEELEPWWVRQDRRKAEAAQQAANLRTAETNNVVPVARPKSPPLTQQLTQQIAPQPAVGDSMLPEVEPLKLDDLNTTTTSLPTKRIIMREIQTQTDNSPTKKTKNKVPQSGRKSVNKPNPRKE